MDTKRDDDDVGSVHSSLSSNFSNSSSGMSGNIEVGNEISNPPSSPLLSSSSSSPSSSSSSSSSSLSASPLVSSSSSSALVSMLPFSSASSLLQSLSISSPPISSSIIRNEKSKIIGINDSKISIFHEEGFMSSCVARAVTTLDGRVVDCNTMFAQLFGIPREDISRYVIYTLFVPQFLSVTFAMISVLISHGGMQQAEVSFSTRGGHLKAYMTMWLSRHVIDNTLFCHFVIQPNSDNSAVKSSSSSSDHNNSSSGFVSSISSSSTLST